MTAPFPIHEALRRVRRAIRPYPPAMLVTLKREGWRSAYAQAVACVLSIRTRDEASLVAARRLFALAPRPEDVRAADVETIAGWLAGVRFPVQKARQIRALAEAATARGGNLPCDEGQLRALPGLGPKCAALVLTHACNQPRVAVDVHVHRVVRRWGLVRTRTPAATQRALERLLPPRIGGQLNPLLVPFGKHVCTPTRPRCSICPLAAFCPKEGVQDAR